MRIVCAFGSPFDAVRSRPSAVARTAARSPSLSAAQIQVTGCRWPASALIIPPPPRRAVSRPCSSAT
jgi:hypothetical protein